MKALLLAAGKGERLSPLTNHLPKCLVPINGIPLLHIWIQRLIEYGIDDIYLNTCYLSCDVKSFVDSMPYSNKINYLDEGTLLGTGRTLFTNKSSFIDDDLLIVHADNASFFNINDFFLEFHRMNKKHEMLMMVFHTDRPSQCGIVEVDDNKNLIGFYEKVTHPPGTLANAAVFIIRRSVLKNSLYADGVEDLSCDLVPKLLGRTWVWENDNYHRDIGDIASLLKSQYQISCDQLPVIDFCSFYGVYGSFGSDKFYSIVTSISEATQMDLYIENGASETRNNCVMVFREYSTRNTDIFIRQCDTRNCLALFWYVSDVFSSKELFDDLGIKSMAFVRGGDGA